MVAGGIAVDPGQEAAVSAEDARTEALVATSLALRPSDRELARCSPPRPTAAGPTTAGRRSALFGSMIGAQGLVDTHRLADATYSAMAVIPGTGTALRAGGESRTHTTIEIVDPASRDQSCGSFDVGSAVPSRHTAETSA